MNMKIMKFQPKANTLALINNEMTGAVICEVEATTAPFVAC